MDSSFLNDFDHTIISAEERLAALTHLQSETPRAPGKWSPKEIIGHLIDSASNNHQRFIRAQFKDDLMFDGYQQDEWVRVQKYQLEEWGALIGLWAAYNRHLLYVVSHIPESILKKDRVHHNLHLRAFKPVPPNIPVSLEFFIIDYVDHLKHHIRQIYPDF